MHAFAFWLKNDYKKFIWLSAASVLIFRSELCIIAGIMLLLIFVKSPLEDFKFVSFFLNAVLAAATSISLSVLVDSFFWKRLLWPEGEVLWFNTVLNKSSEWGTSPFLWYFYSAIPRATLFSLLLLPLAFLYNTKSTIVNLLLPAVGFVFVYSLLPHKELRFIIYVFPILNAIAAKGLVDL